MEMTSGKLDGINQRGKNIPIPTPPEFEEAPQVEVTETPVVETPVEEVKTEEPVKEQEMTEHRENAQVKAPEIFSRKNFSAIRIDGKSDGVEMRSKIKSMSNQALYQLKKIFEPKEGETFSVPQEVAVDGVVLRNSNTIAVFEEGGAAYGDGYALTVCGPKGEKLQASSVYTNDDILNGLHALIPVKTDNIILLGIRVPKDLTIITAYRVASFERTEEGKAQVHCQLLAAFYDGDITKSSDAGDFAFDYNTPVVKATAARLSEDFAVTPCWVNDWTSRSFYQKDFFKDFVDAMSDTKFIGSMTSYTSLETMYHDVSELLRKKVKGLTKLQHGLCTTVLDINNKDKNGNEAVYVFVSGIVYDVSEKTSKNGRFFYGRVILHPGDSFFYIDNPDCKIPYEKVASALKSDKTANGHYKFIADTVKRMTI